MSNLLTDIEQELGGNDHPDEVDKYMVKNVGEGHLLPEMKDCITKVQNLVTQTDGRAWATAFAEVSTLLLLLLLLLFLFPFLFPARVYGRGSGSNSSLTSSEEPRSAPKHSKVGH
jgi:hypothetical protein